MINPSFVKAYENLNTAQKEAVDSTEGPLMVIAGPGTGKTELLALRVANIINKTEASPNNILCLTFTDNAAINMQERLVRYIGQDAYRVGIFTFHSFCNSIILDYPEYFYNAASFKNASDQDKSQIILDIFSSLPYSHPLASTHPEQGYVFLKDVLSRIKDLKAAGFSPSEYQEKIDNLEKQYDQINKVLRFYPEGRNSIKRLEEFRVFANELLAINSDCAMFLSQTLNQAINEASEMGKTTPIGDWKNKYTKKVDCDIVFTDSVKLEKIKGVAEIYNLYKQAMYNAALYDYDDMILDVALELKNNLTLRSELEDKYEYILIDEFQDTNEAQMNLVKAITSCSARPNIMVVGDDDQAIYRFQGAEISNIIEFRKNIYQDVKTIVLSKNYRSHQDILNFARGVVQNGSNRLEKHFSDINKALTQSNLNIDKCNININMYGSDTDEYENVAKEIKIQIENGIKPEEIAVLARNHRELQNILPFFDRHNIPYEYKNKSNVFDELHIKELINIMEYVSSVNSETINKDYLLPIILSFPYFNIPRLTLFEMAVEGKKNYTPWSELIIQYEDEKVKKVSLLLAELIAKADVLPLEHLIDYYVKESGFKDYYFSADILKNSPSTYIYFMASLKTFIDALREWRSEEVLLAKDIAPFVALHQERKISLTCDSPLIKASNCVQIMTAHSAKGLEFEQEDRGEARLLFLLCLHH